MSETGKYNLVHITTDGEYKAPLVASQLFDQAECQAVNRGDKAPEKTEAWIVGPIREYMDKSAQEKLASLRARCPHIGIRMINGVSRLDRFPVMQLLHYYRNKLGNKLPVIYHCRGDAAAEWAAKLRKSHPGDKVVLDVRGYWPAEKLYRQGIEYPELAQGADREEYNELRNILRNSVNRVDAVTTVSNALRELLIADAGAPESCVVVPCCVSAISNDNERSTLRKNWGVADDELLIVYSGTTAAYQHLEDLTIPFMNQLAASNPKVKLAFFSSEVEQIRDMLLKSGANMDRIILKSFKQQEVAGALTACDAGILIRKPTLVNRVANPVKIAEYLAAGLPIIIERGVGGVAEIMFEQGILHGLTLTGENCDTKSEIQATNQWLKEDIANRRAAVRTYASKVYLWNAAIQVSRKMYATLLSGR